jgi:hypothetical protein
LLLVACAPAAQEASRPEPVDPATRVRVAPDSDPQAIEIAQAVMEKMGGWDSWDRARYLRWTFFGDREHHWDRHTGEIRIEGSIGPEDEYVFAMNVDTLAGRVWKNGEEIIDAGSLAQALELGHKIWVNDSYWLVMPYKLLDPGVTLKHAGERTMDDGRMADILDMTFGDSVGYTPENRYEIYVAQDTGLVEQWSFFATAEDQEPQFSLPWKNWQPFGDILLATSKGRDMDWEIVVSDDVPEGVFEVGQE